QSPRATCRCALLPRRGRARRTPGPGPDRRLTIRTLSRLLFAAYFLEAGFILVVAPWSAFWDHNRFAATRPALEAFLNSPYARGAVTGVGVITALAGLAEL